MIATSRTPSRTPELVKNVEQLGGIWLPFDVSSRLPAHQSLVKEAIDRFGRIDVLVNCAGMSIVGAVEDFRYILILYCLVLSVHFPQLKRISY